MGTYIIAEAGINHNGDVALARKLCKAAKECGADAVKFQTWVTEKIITRNVHKAEYQEQKAGDEETQFDMLKKIELSYNDFVNVKEYCDEIGITFLSTADEADSLDFIIGLGIPFIKIGSGEKGNIPYLRYIGSKGLPVVLSTGMSTMDEVEVSVNALREGGTTDITLLHCTTSYPCPYECVNLKAMNTLREKFNLPVGYSDHTIGIEIPIAAVAMGAAIIEKHFTLDRNMDGPDHKASTDPKEFRRMVEAIRNTERAFGDGIKKPSLEEMANAEVVIKRIVAKTPIEKGQIITIENLTTKRNEIGAPASEWDRIVGTKADREYNIDDGIDTRRD